MSESIPGPEKGAQAARRIENQPDLSVLDTFRKKTGRATAILLATVALTSAPQLKVEPTDSSTETKFIDSGNIGDLPQALDRIQWSDVPTDAVEVHKGNIERHPIMYSLLDVGLVASLSAWLVSGVIGRRRRKKE